MKARLTIIALFSSWLALSWTTATSALSADAATCDAKAKAANLTFALKDVNGRSVKLADFKGKVVILNFWATWCVPCRAEIPALVELQAKYREKGLQVVGVSVDDPIEKMRPFISKYKVNYPVLTAYQNEAILDAYGPMVVVPVTVIIQRDGTICLKHIGPATRENFEKEIQGLL